MMQESRTMNSLRNIFFSIGYQIIMLLLNFLSRSVFVGTLGVGYLGINGLFTNIFSVLSLAELGVGSAMIYGMYKPLAENDHKKLSALIHYYKKLYNIIALSIFCLGIILIPFLPYLINLENSIENVNIYYILFLIDTVSSYLFIYKTSIITANQQDYKLKIYNTISSLLRFVLQIIALWIFHSFFAYILIKVIISIITNYICGKKAEQLYPYILSADKLDINERKKIWTNIKSMFSYKIGGVILNNTDQLLISVLVTTEAVGLYSNYKIPVTAITGITSMFFISLQSSIGNLNATSNRKIQYELFQKLNICSFWLYGFTSICLCILLQDFVLLWLGTEYLLDEKIVYATVAIYYSTGILYPIWNFRETIGLFKYTKNILFYTSLINLVLSFVLGKKMGMIGILVATIISRLITNMWFEPYKLFKIFFERKVSYYFRMEIVNVIIILIIIFSLKIIISSMTINNLLTLFVLKLGLCLFIPNIVFYIYLEKNKYFIALKEKALSLYK